MSDNRARDWSNAKPIVFKATEIRDAASETQCFAVSERTRQLVLAMAQVVGWKTRYDTEVTQDEIDTWEADLTYQMMNSELCEPDTEDEECIEYPATSLFITYLPNDPFQTPDFTPPRFN